MGGHIGARWVAPMCSPMWGNWHHLANTIELVLPSAHPSPQPKQQIDLFKRFLHSSLQCHLVHWRHLANVIEIVHIGAIWQIIQLNCASFGPPKSTP